MEITRAYDHRGGKRNEAFGRIGQVTLTVPDGEWKMDGETVAPAGVMHLINFALQTFLDSYAGAESAVEAIAAFNKKRESVINGTIGTRTGGGTSDPVQELAEKMARDEIAITFAAIAGLGKDGSMPRMATVRDNLPKDDRDKLTRFGEFGGKSGNTFDWNPDTVAAYVEKNGLRNAAEKELAKRKKAAESVDLSKLDI